MAREKETGEVVALKKVRMDQEKEGVRILPPPVLAFLALQVVSLKPQTSNLKPQTRNVKPETCLRGHRGDFSAHDCEDSNRPVVRIGVRVRVRVRVRVDCE